MNRWAVIRLVLVLGAFAEGVLWKDFPVASARVTSKGLFNLGYAFAFGILVILAVVGVNRVLPLAKTWRYPRWSINPFQILNPLQLLHLLAFVVVGFGAGLELAQLLGGINGLVSLFVLTFGAGMVAGVYLSTMVYSGKMSADG